MHELKERYLYTKQYEDKKINLDEHLSGREKRNKRRKEQRKKK
jgi:hypothetical protein